MSPTIQRSAAISDTGRRESNQDAFVVDDELGLYIVADGVGGHQAGDVASATATRVIGELVADWRGQDPKRREHGSALVHRAIESACAAIHRDASEQPKLAGMSTTVTVVLIDGHRAVMGHVGDSRLYLLREGMLEQISTDHTLAAELYRGGVITREHVDHHPHTHVLTRSCGSQPSVMVETLLLDLHPGDLLLLCSDGLNPALHPPQWVVDQLDSTVDLEAALARLVEQAKAAGSRDNITAVAWRRDGGDHSLARGTVDALRSIPLFAKLDVADLTRVVAEMHTCSHEAGEVILKQGERSGALHVVLEGRLRWELSSGHFAYLERGEGIGTTTLVAARRCPATLSADRPSQVLVLSCKAFRNLARLRPRLGAQLLLALADQLSDWIDPDTDHGVARPPLGLLVEF